MDEIFVGVLVVLGFGSMSVVLLIAGLRQLRQLEQNRINTIGHMKSMVATFQILVGGFGLCFTLCQGFLLIRNVSSLL